jgi:DNA-binding transcriptional regulator GbsR (MarR family)
MTEMAQRTERHTERDEDAVRRFVERFALDLAAAGVPRMAARVFAGILAAENGKLTAAEIGEELQVSPAAVSGAVRYLVQMGLVAREREPGARRDHYRIYDDTWSESIVTQDEMIGRWDDVLAEGVDAVGPGSAAGKRLQENRDFFTFLRAELPDLLARWRRQRDAGRGA